MAIKKERSVPNRLSREAALATPHPHISLHPTAVIGQFHLVIANSADWCRCQALVLNKPLETGLPLARDRKNMIDLAKRLFYLAI